MRTPGPGKPRLPSGEERMAGIECPYDENKFRELIVYIANRSQDDRFFGAVKLNKILYYADFYAHRRLGRSISGADYQKLPEGPAPRQLLQARASLLSDDSVRMENRQVFNHVQQRLVPNRPEHPGVLTDEEAELVDEVLAALWNKNAKEVSAMSHEELGWKLVSDYETIPYRTAFLSSEPLTQDQVERAMAVARRHELIGRLSRPLGRS
jgi:hypothetical protein